MNQKNVLILLGGCSPEHDISMASAASVMGHMDGYNIVPVCVTREGKWLLYDGKLDNIRNIDWEKFGTPAVLSPDRVNRGLLRIVGDKVKVIPVDVVFPILHGENGEDGSVQGLCQLAGIPCVGCGMLSSAVCMDKTFSKTIVKQLGIPQADYFVFQDEQLDDPETVMKTIRYKLGYPCFIKPAISGSSIGISMVRNKKELCAALEIAAGYSNKIIAEKYVRGREIECGVLGVGADARASCPGEIIADGEFYDYDAKYIRNGSQMIVPADLPSEVLERIQQISLDVFRAVDGKGLARVDFFVEETGRVVFNEINTIPGFTTASMYLKMWEASGVPAAELIDKLINIACA